MRSSLRLLIVCSILGLMSGTATLRSQSARPFDPFRAVADDSLDDLQDTSAAGIEVWSAAADSHYLRTSRRTEAWDSSSGTWIPQYNDATFYDSLQRPSADLNQMWMGSGWYSYNRSVYTYDASNNRTEYLLQVSNGLTLEDAARYVYAYDEENRLVGLVQETWQESLWVGYTRYAYAYDAQGRRESSVRQTRDTLDWQDDIRYLYSYDEAGRRTANLYQEYRLGSFENSRLQTYSYDAHGGVLSMSKFSWINGAWSWYTMERYATTYDEVGRPLEQATERRHDTTWTPSSRSTYVYRSDGKLVSRIFQKYMGGWYNSSAWDYDYFPGGNLHTRTVRHWTDGGYQNLSREVSEWEVFWTSVGDPSGVAAEFRLNDNYPNPFNPSTTISYDLPAASPVTLSVYDLLGRVVASLVEERQDAGRHEATWTATGAASGVYYYRLQAIDVSNPGRSFMQVKKMLLLR